MMATILHYYGAVSIGWIFGFATALLLARPFQRYLKWRRRRLWFNERRPLRYR